MSEQTHPLTLQCEIVFISGPYHSRTKFFLLPTLYPLSVFVHTHTLSLYNVWVVFITYLCDVYSNGQNYYYQRYPLCVFVHTHTLSLYNVWVVFITYLCDMCIAMGEVFTTNAIFTLCLCPQTHPLTIQCVRGLYHLPMWYVSLNRHTLSLYNARVGFITYLCDMCPCTDTPSHYTICVSGLYHLGYYTPSMFVLLLHSTYEWLLSSVCTLTHESYTLLLVPRQTRRWWPLCVFVHRHTLSL